MLVRFAKNDDVEIRDVHLSDCRQGDEAMLGFRFTVIESVQGHCEFRSPEAVVLSSGMSLLLPPALAVEWRVRGQMKRIDMALSEACSRELIGYYQHDKAIISSDRALIGLGQAALDELTQPLLDQMFARALAVLLARRIGHRALQTEPLEVDPQIAKLLQYIDHKLGYQIGVEDLMQQVQLNRAQLARLLQSYRSGLSPYQLILERRLRKASALLLQTELPIGVISDQVGFASLAHFSASFRDAMNESPRDHRKRLARARVG